MRFIHEAMKGEDFDHALDHDPTGVLTAYNDVVYERDRLVYQLEACIVVMRGTNKGLGGRIYSLTVRCETARRVIDSLKVPPAAEETDHA